ncbi:SlyX family protein [Terrihabitans sp. B22-R8]|uniref:SlyX family protein n=1 Tax=Terrihabitans sp. B22-R8 TaxID=3425128 RepID=UPI00403CA895
MSETSESRLEALEIRVAYQDQTIEDLNETITAQWKEIERLSADFRRLSDRLQQTEQSLPLEDEPPPPHY